MVYTTTKLQQLKSYATYQFHTMVKSAELKSSDIFKICILETFRWLRGRLSEYKNIPSDIILPEPEEYEKLKMDQLHSFIVNSGVVIDVVYIEKKGLWSFCLTESDMGANKGTPEERPAVNGRTFSTEISFILGEDHVEAGFRIICAEPAECTQQCEGFRPAVVRALAENDKLYFECEGYRVDGKSILVKNKAALNTIESIWKNANFDLPFVFIADGPFPDEKDEAKPDLESLMNLNAVFSPFRSYMSIGTDAKEKLLTAPLNINYPDGKISKNIKAEKKNGTVEKTEVHKEEKARERMPVVDYEGLAKSFVAQAVVAFVDARFYKNLQDKLGIILNDGEILVNRKGKEILSYSYPEYQDDLKAMEKRLKNEVRAVSKHQNYWFGNIGRHSDAKLTEVQIRMTVTGTYKTELDGLREENRILSEKITEMSQQEFDKDYLMDELQNTKRCLKGTEDRLRDAEEKKDKLAEQIGQLKNTLDRVGNITKFFDEQWKEAASFPTEKDKICTWIRKRFPETIYLTKRAESACSKYDGVLSIPELCDGIIYLDAYARYKLGKIDNAMLELYSARNSWSPDGCGKETLRVRKDDYSVSYEGKTKLLDLHLKSGISNGNLMRIYFLWDAEMKKIIIGYMPGHLATRKKGT